MNGAAQMTAERILGGGLVEATVALHQLRQLDRDLLAIAAELLQ